jgi:hypothetical protein
MFYIQIEYDIDYGTIWQAHLLKEGRPFLRVPLKNLYHVAKSLKD